MMFVTFTYINFYDYSGDKGLVILIVCEYRMIEAFFDVFQGMFQQNERLDLSSKSLAIKVLVSSFIFCIVLYKTNNLLLQ